MKTCLRLCICGSIQANRYGQAGIVRLLLLLLDYDLLLRKRGTATLLGRRIWHMVRHWPLLLLYSLTS